MYPATQSQPKLMYNPKDGVLMIHSTKIPEGKKATVVKFCAGCGSQYRDMLDLTRHVKSDDRCPLKEG